MSAKFEALSFTGFIAFIASPPLVAAAATIWPHWLIAPFALTGITGFWLWVNWILRKARAR